jgi:hypothetical protein
LLAYPNAVGVGVGPKYSEGEQVDDERAVVVMVDQKKPVGALEAEHIIPHEYMGMRTDVWEVGELKALDRTDEWVPAPGGVSVGHYKITAGTLGAVVRSRGVNRQRFILSNNHVLANSNDAEIGDAILQPGPVDGGFKPIARLVNFVPIDFGAAPPTCDLAKNFAKIVNWAAEIIGSKHRVRAVYEDRGAINLVDAAIARPDEEGMVDDEILDIGKIVSRTTATLGLKVKKSGRTTGLTTGTVRVIGATVNVGYGEGRLAMFENQIVTGGMSEPGDSGSLLVSEQNEAVGLLFAGSDQATIYSPIQTVCDLLGVDFYA